MTNREMNRRLSTLAPDHVEHIQRLLRNGYDARWIHSNVRKWSLSQISAVVKLDTHWIKAA